MRYSCVIIWNELICTSFKGIAALAMGQNWVTKFDHKSTDRHQDQSQSL